MNIVHQLIGALTAQLLTVAAPALLVADDSKVLSRVGAVRAYEEVKVDGVFSEKVWQRTGFDSFTERDPNEGTKPSQRTEVWLAYDSRSLYVAARMFDKSPDSIVARLARRDTKISSDYFVFYVDSYHDRRSGFYFSVNAAGTIGDGSLYNDDWSDNTWDGVWESKAQIDSLGWTVEIRIPFSQLRFQRDSSYVWGINFERFISRSNEDDYVVYTPKNSSGFVSRFVELEGISDLQADRPLELLPYFTTKAEYMKVDAGDPFNDGSRYTPGIGGDFKMGIGNNLTLDGTVNPDFGQVEVDPAVMNLSDIQTYYSEKRPFFIEGADIFGNFGFGGSNSFWNFSFGNPEFFYSRRIGGPPQGSVPDADYVNVPTGSRIIGAAKLTGRIGDGWTIGTIHAVTARETAKVDTAGTIYEIPVEPLTYYGVARVRKEIGDGMQGIGLISTLSERNFRNDILRDQLNSSEFVLGVDGWSYLDNSKMWVITGWSGMSQARGNRDRIISLQESAAHYLQRPDAGYVHIDSSAASLTGYAGRLSLNKQKGNVYVNAAFGFIDPKFDVSDLGFMWRGDVINGHAVVGYLWTEPGKFARSGQVFLALFRSYDFGGDVTWTGLYTQGGITFLNYYSVNAWFAYNPQSVSDYATRGGPKMLNLPGYETDFQVSSDDRKEWVANGEVHHMNYRSGDLDVTYYAGIQWTPRPNVTFSLTPSYEQSNWDAQWVGEFDDPLATATFGKRYVFATLKQKTISANIRLNWAFTPQLSLQLFAQPFVSAGSYHGFKELARPKSYDFVRYGEGNSSIIEDGGTFTVNPDLSGSAQPFTFSNPDFNFKSLRGDVILRWEYVRGSTLYLVWTQDRTDDRFPGFMQISRDFRSLVSTPPSNIFLIKLTYWFNV